MGQPIYTIGYGDRTIDEFIALLQRYAIEYLVDIRSMPYSKYKPEFSKAPLETKLGQSKIKYIFMGDLLGGQPKDVSYYTDGKVDYALLKQSEFYKKGIFRLKTALTKQLIVALMCSEKKPHECHRSKLIGETLAQNGVAVMHIDENGLLQTQQTLLNQLTNGQMSLFEMAFTSRKRYQKEDVIYGI